MAEAPEDSFEAMHQILRACWVALPVSQALTPDAHQDQIQAIQGHLVRLADLTWRTLRAFAGRLESLEGGRPPAPGPEAPPTPQ